MKGILIHHTARQLALRVATAVLIAASLVLIPTAVASAATGRISIQPCLNHRAGPDGNTALIGCIPNGTVVTIECVAQGNPVTGPWGKTTIWDRVTYAGKTGFVSDAYVYTGTNSAVAPGCPSVTPPPPPPTSPAATTPPTLANDVDAFVARWNGRYADYDGVYGAQCVDLYSYYLREVIGARIKSVGYAYRIYGIYDTSKFTRVAAGAKPRKGDVAIWTSNFPGSGGGGHVAIVLADAGSHINVLTQRPGATKVANLTKRHLRGYLRPVRN